MTRSVTVREPEYAPRDLALLLQALSDEREPRNHLGVKLSDATDAANNPYSPDAKGRFVAEPVADFSQAAVDAARERRRKAVGDDDWPLLWRVHLESEE